MQSHDGMVSCVENLPFQHVIYAMNVAKSSGINIEPYLQSTGLSPIVQQGNASDISRLQYYQFIEHVIEQVNIPAFGLQVGQAFSNADYGVLGYAFLSSPTLGDALRTFIRFQSIVGSDGAFREELYLEGDLAVIKIFSNIVNNELYRFEVEEAVGQWNAIDVILQGGKTIEFTKVHFTFSRPDYADYLKQQLGCPVLFEQASNEIYFAKGLLTERFTMANELTAQICTQQCELLLKNLKSKGGLAEDVRCLIINQPGKTPSSPEIAQKLHISDRTLRRRLKEESTSFKEIINEVRMSMAQEYLRHTTLSIQEIAYLLEYSEASNFHRAFKNWSQQTPSDYRISLAEA